MDSFVMEIAGVPIQVEPLFESTKAYCRDYLTERMPAYNVTVTREDFVQEQKLLDIEADEEGLKRRKFSDMFLERSVIQRRVAEYLISQDVILMHGSTVAVDGHAYLFTAACGTGKSTHTRLWRDVFGFRAVMVNDDKPFLRFLNGEVLAYGSPWTGKHGLGTNVCCPLKGICILKRGKEDLIYRIAPDQARDMLLHQCFQPESDDRILPMVERLMERVSLWEMECTKERSAALTAWEAMSEVII